MELNEIKIGNIIIYSNDSEKYKKNELLDTYWKFHPRFRYFKTIPPNSKMLDIGAGSGGLFFWKEWNEPIRKDIMLYAIDLKKGQFFDEYADYQICNLDKDKLKFQDEFFDSVLMSHVIEHIQDEDKLLLEIKRVLKIGGRIYIEIPTIETLKYPSKELFFKNNINVQIVNFYDDKTHIRTFKIDELAKIINKLGFKIIEMGNIENAYLDKHLLSYGIAQKDLEIIQYGIWSQLKWAQYLICERSE